MRAEIQEASRPGQATMKVYEGKRLLFQATSPGLSDITQSKFSPDGKWLLNIAGYSGYVQLWDVEKGKRVKTFLAPTWRPHATFSPNSQGFMLSFRSSPNSFTRVAPSYWDIETLKQATVFDYEKAG